MEDDEKRDETKKFYPNIAQEKRSLGGIRRKKESGGSPGNRLSYDHFLPEALGVEAMRKFRETFNKDRVVLPVIHVESRSQATRNVGIASIVGCDGVFLINHEISHVKLLGIYKKIREKFPRLWIGINLLDRHPMDVFNDISKSGIDGVWVDNAMIREKDERQRDAKRIQFLIKEVDWQGLYFGGIAFKYQPDVTDLEFVTKQASRFMDVVTTSGSSTGKPADLRKIRLMRDCVRVNFPLAVASGITPENVHEYLPFVNAFLVATGVSDNFLDLNEVRLKSLVTRVSMYSEG